MTPMKLEHINITVPDPDDTAAVLCHLFGWKLRWSGGALNNGYSVHVGDTQSYLALYRPNKPLADRGDHYAQVAGLNHVGVVADDISAIEARVKAAGYTPHSHADYEPGQRFYFKGPDQIEFEVVHYG